MADFGKAPLEQVLARMADTKPGPAAGSAAALSAAMAAALIQKAARLSARQLPDAEDLAGRAGALRRRLLELAEEDASAVIAMLTGTGPSGPAATVPRQIGDHAAELAELADRLSSKGNPRLLADAVSARRLAEAAEAAVVAIVESNRQQDTTAGGQAEPG